MSLTRAQWVELWEETKKIERLANLIKDANPQSVSKLRAKTILVETQKIKDKIESVIGQME